jgi:predicted esterase
MRDIVGTRGFVLCPCGVPYDRPPQEGRFGFTTQQALSYEVDAALDALVERFSGYVDPEPLIYVGFSRGSYLGVPLVATEPELYSRAIFIEGGHDDWNDDRIRMFGAAGGRRVLFACGQPVCASDARRIAAMLEAVRVQSRVAYAPGEGHVYSGKVGREIAKGFDWLIAGDARWADVR